MTQTKFTWHVLQSGPALGGGGPIWIIFGRPRFPVNLHQGLYNWTRGPVGSNWSNGLNAGPNYSCDFLQFAPLNNNPGLWLSSWSIVDSDESQIFELCDNRSWLETRRYILPHVLRFGHVGGKQQSDLSCWLEFFAKHAQSAIVCLQCVAGDHCLVVSCVYRISVFHVFSE